MDIAKPPLPTKEIQFRKLKAIDIDSFTSDIVASGLPSLLTVNVDVLIVLTDRYNSVLSGLLDKHATLKKKTITVHPEALWRESSSLVSKLNGQTSRTSTVMFPRDMC